MVSALGFSDMLSLAQTVRIVGTMVLTLYFSKKQIRSLSIDTQTRGLNDLGEKLLKIVERVAEDTSIQGVMDNQVKYSREGAYSFYILEKPSPPIMIGGTRERQTLRIVAKYGDACNLPSFGSVETVKRKLSILKEHCKNIGRDYDSILKSQIRLL
jgi:hypothetical protein